MSAPALLQVLESAADIAVITDGEGVVKYANAAVERVLGYDRAEIVGTSVFDFLHHDEVSGAANSLASTAASSELPAVPLALRVRASSGDWRWLEVVATNLLSDPSVAGILFQCRELSGRHEDHRRLREMFERSPVAQALMRPGQVGVIANAAFARLFGTTREVLLSMRGNELLHPEEQPRLEADYGKLLAGELERLIGTRRYLRADGHVFHGRVAASVLRDSAGAFEYVFVTVEDISAEIEASDALARSEARARALIDHSPDIIAIVYPDGEWEVNDQGTRLLGYPKDFEPAGGVLSLVHPDDLARATMALREVTSDGRTPFDFVEVRLRAYDGTYRQFECVTQNLTDDHHIGGVVVTARDVTGRKETEARLRAAEQRFSVAYTHGPTAMSIVDLDGRILDINPAACSMLGRTRDEMIGTLAELTIHPADRAHAIERTAAQLADPSLPVEFRLMTADGNAITVLSHAALVEPTTADDKPYVVTLQSDISDRKRLEAELENRASQDPLTGLYNRTALHHHLERELARRRSGVLAAIFFDLDNFKTVNDAFGHEAGDELLCHVARQLRSNLRAADIAARVGGDEFIVICDTATVDDARAIAERFRTEISTNFRYDDHPIEVSASLGIAFAQAGDNIGTLLRRADTAVYVAKRAGKARTEVI